MSDGYTVDDLREHLGYLASPYTNFHTGLDDAAFRAAEIAGLLFKHDVYVYSPVVHCHSISYCADIDPLDAERWLKHCKRMAERCDILIIADMPGWNSSKGVAKEARWFGDAGKSVFLFKPETMAIGRA